MSMQLYILVVCMLLNEVWGGCDVTARHDCSGVTESGVYTIYPCWPSRCGYHVYCSVEDDGAWTVFQRRMDGSVNFDRTWEEYKNGFGDLTGEHWLGNEALHCLTRQSNHLLKVELRNAENETRFATYNTFRVRSETKQYDMFTDGYSGTAGNAMKVYNYSGYYVEAIAFTTKDRDYDYYYETIYDYNTYFYEYINLNCAEKYSAGWWYLGCERGNLNGLYDGGIIWSTWSTTGGLKASEMKIKSKT